jgi:hypothetical protein
MITLVLLAALGGILGDPESGPRSTLLGDPEFVARVVPTSWKPVRAARADACSPLCGCAFPGECGTKGCACESAVASKPRVVKAASAKPARYWITLTNEPGVRALGRIEGGYAVDIERRERIPRYVTPAPVPLPVQAPRYFYAPAQPAFFRGYGATSCGPGGCR